MTPASTNQTCARLTLCTSKRRYPLEPLIAHWEPPLPQHDWRQRTWLQEANQAFAAGHYREAMRAYLLAQALRPGLNAGLEASLNLCLKRLLDSHTPQQQRLTLPLASEPLVSILVPMHEQLLATAACLCAIADHSGGMAYEVLVLNDASSEHTRQTLERMEGLRLINQPRNLGFLHNCNAGAQEARGRYLVWLNNDTLVQPGWLDALVEMAELQPSAGAVGAQLRYPDGRLQEVGGIVWRDGSAARVGDGQWPDPRLTVRPRDVDYCSAAVLLVRRSLWQELGGFDPRYAPAYYEDTDLCFRIRAAGYRVLVEPRAQVVHFEGLSHGHDPNTGSQALQAINQTRFAERWRTQLEREHQPRGQNGHWAMDRAQARPVVLVADHKLPEADRDAGSRSILHLMRSLMAGGALVVFWPHNPALPEPYRQQLEAEGIALLVDAPSPADLAAWVREQGPVLDWLLLSRPDVAEAVVNALGNEPGLRVAYYGHDLHHRRLLREAAYGRADAELLQRTAQALQQEQQAWQQASLIYYPAADEVAEVQQWLREQGTTADVRQLPVFAYPAPSPARIRAEQPQPPAARLLFVAGFAHPPNTDAALWFMRQVWPLVQQGCPEVRLWLVGSHPPASIQELASPAIGVSGNVSDAELEQHYRHARVVVAPIRHGAGVNGKIVEALAHGVPCVCTPEGARGFSEPDGALRIAADPHSFAMACLELLGNNEAWQHQRQLALAYVAERFSQARQQEALAPLLQQRLSDTNSQSANERPSTSSA